MEDQDILWKQRCQDLSLFRTINAPDVIDHINRVGGTFYRRK